MQTALSMDQAPQPTPTSLASAAGISVPYASQILSGDRPASRALAVHIFKLTGWRHETISSLTLEQIDFLAGLEPWTPRRSTKNETAGDADRVDTDTVSPSPASSDKSRQFIGQVSA